MTEGEALTLLEKLRALLGDDFLSEIVDRRGRDVGLKRPSLPGTYGPFNWDPFYALLTRSTPAPEGNREMARTLLDPALRPNRSLNRRRG